MHKITFNLDEKASISLVSILNRKVQNLRPTPAARAVGFVPSQPGTINESDWTPILVETHDPDAVRQVVTSAPAGGEVEPLEGRFLSVRTGSFGIRALIDSPAVDRLQSKKRSVAHLTGVLPDVRVIPPQGGPRNFTEDGQGVLIGIVDTGFDLSHPMFRDSNGNLRVDGLLDQVNGNREFDSQALATQWASGSGPGADEHGHGTHVASIAGGSRFNNIEGMAPGARFLLVKTDFENTDRAVAWIFQKANRKACVVNMSLGHHFGSHDGTDSEERLHRTLTGPGKIIVISAGNERNDNLHVGGQFHPSQSEEVTFDLLRRQDGAPRVILPLWWDQTDDFDVTLITPSGQTLPQPAMGTTDNYQSSTVDIEVSRRPYTWSQSVQTQITIGFRDPEVRDLDLRNWRLRLACRTAVIGRLDGWFHNSGFALFRDHPRVDHQRTVGIAATGDGCLAVASHVTRTAWDSDVGRVQDDREVLERSSSFSSQGPTRDGRAKPDLSAPGEYVTAALADHSRLSQWNERALANQRLLTIEGTSMAAPVVTGIVALLLQKKANLDVPRVREALRQAARHDAHTGAVGWDPSYGFGKVDVAAALQKI